MKSSDTYLYIHSVSFSMKCVTSASAKVAQHTLWYLFGVIMGEFYNITAVQKMYTAGTNTDQHASLVQYRVGLVNRQ